MRNTIKCQEARTRRKKSIRKRVTGTQERPRLSVFRSARHIYAQVIDDVTGQTLVSASTVESATRDPEGELNKRDVAKLVGLRVAERCVAKSITKVVFDRNGFIYHGRVKNLADGAREGGLDF